MRPRERRPTGMGPAIGLLLALLLAGCQREELKTVGGNVPPPDTLVSQERIAGYANGLYVSLLGRKPDSSENLSAITSLKSSNLSIASREALITSLMARQEYAQRVFDILRAELLNNVDTNEIKFQISQHRMQLQNVQGTPAAPVFAERIADMERLLLIPADVQAGRIPQTEVYRRAMDNFFYDEVNMGSENFVLASFESFCRRLPTVSELQTGVAMVDGQRGVLLLQEGSNKADYIQILLSTREYYQGQVIALYLRYLLRQPSSVELDALTRRYQSGASYQDLQRTILSSDEYAGLR